MSASAMELYRTHDMALCAFLHLEGFGHITVRKVAEQRAEMAFEDSPELRAAVARYREGRAEVEPREFQRKIGWVRGILLDTVFPDR